MRWPSSYQRFVPHSTRGWVQKSISSPTKFKQFVNSTMTSDIYWHLLPDISSCALPSAGIICRLKSSDPDHSSSTNVPRITTYLVVITQKSSAYRVWSANPLLGKGGSFITFINVDVIARDWQHCGIVSASDAVLRLLGLWHECRLWSR